MSAKRNGGQRGAGPGTHRGGVYLAVLAIALIVSIVGMSALLLVRGEQRGRMMNETGARADFYAQSTIDLAAFYLQTLPWRSGLANNTWTTVWNVGGAALSIKAVDELDGDLSNDANQPFRLYGKAVCGDALRIYSVRMQPRTRPNIVPNGDFEGGTSGWSSYWCTLNSRTDSPHGGSNYLYVTGRWFSNSSPYQTVTSVIRSGHTYDFTGWALMDTTSRTVQPVLEVNTSAGSQYFTGAGGTVGTSTWTKVTGAMTPSWTGTVNYVKLWIMPSSGTNSYKLDDLVLQDREDGPAFIPIAGTWRRETGP